MLNQEQGRQWQSLTAGIVDVFENSQTWARTNNHPGLASWFSLAGKVWDELRHSPTIADLMFDDLQEVVREAGPSCIALASWYVARHLPVQDHYYVCVLEVGATKWRDVFLPDLTFPDYSAPQLGGPKGAEETVVPRDQFDQAILDAFEAVRVRHTEGCGCTQCRVRTSQFDAWAKSLGINQLGSTADDDGS